MLPCKPCRAHLTFHPCCRGSKDSGLNHQLLTATGGFTLSVAPKGVGQGSPAFALGMQSSAGPHSDGAKPFTSAGNAQFTFPELAVTFPIMCNAPHVFARQWPCCLATLGIAPSL